MQITLCGLDERRRAACEALRVRDGQRAYIAGNADSLKTAEAYPEVARAFALCDGERVVGFAMLAFDADNEDPEDRFWLWRFMIDGDLQGRGYGTAALEAVIHYFRAAGADVITLSTKPDNAAALHLYHRAGFRENGRMNGDETVLKLALTGN